MCTVPGRFFLSVRTLAPTDLTIFNRELTILLFHSLIKLTFLVSKGPLCLYDKQNYTWLHVDMKFLFSCSTRQLDNPS